MRLFAGQVGQDDPARRILTMEAPRIASMREYLTDYIPDVGNCLDGIAVVQGCIDNSLNVVTLGIAEAVRIQVWPPGN
jgi:hypothetical protein